jgi:hypothetical protein
MYDHRINLFTPNYWEEETKLLDLSTPDRHLWAAVLVTAMCDYGHLVIKKKRLFSYESQASHNITEIVDWFDTHNQQHGPFKWICEVLAGERWEEFIKVIIKFINNAEALDYDNLKIALHRRKGSGKQIHMNKVYRGLPKPTSGVQLDLFAPKPTVQKNDT